MSFDFGRGRVSTTTGSLVHMRQGQNVKRARRGRKPHNFMGRTLDSSGPEVKIRGTAAHICEKYQALARDAHSSGDRIGAENYLQHAEHYFRLLSSFQNATAQNGVARPNGAGGEIQPDGEAMQFRGGQQGDGADDDPSDEAGAVDSDDAGDSAGNGDARA